MLAKSCHSKCYFNKCLLSLLNTTYKIFYKTLHMCLQPLLVEVIDNHQTAFLPLRFIPSNSFLRHECIQWAKESRQDTIFLKLDFSKVHDRVDFVYVQSQ